MSLTKRWHLLATLWYWAVLCSLILSSLLFLVRFSGLWQKWNFETETKFPGRSNDGLRRTEFRLRSEIPLLILCTIAGLLFFIGATLIVDHPTPRFLTSAAWLA